MRNRERATKKERKKKGKDIKAHAFVSDDALMFMLNTLPGGSSEEESQLRPVGASWLN